MMNMTKIHLIISILVVCTVQVSAQEVTFQSKLFELGVRSHLALDESSVIDQSLTDTITMLDLSGYGLTDIQDVAYLPELRILNLRDNKIKDLSPLILLDSLHVLDLMRNELTEINILAFTPSDHMEVNVSMNQIKDFSFLFSSFSCKLTLVGTAMQGETKEDNLSVLKLCTSLDDDYEPVIRFRALAKIDSIATLKIGEFSTTVRADGRTRTFKPETVPDTTTMVVITDGEVGDTTYLFPNKTFSVIPSSTKTLTVELPDSFYMKSMYAEQGDCSFSSDFKSVIYQAPDEFVADTITICLFKNGSLKANMLCFITPGEVIPGDVNADGKVDVSDVTALVATILGTRERTKACDVNGDGTVDVSDVTNLVSIILKGE